MPVALHSATINIALLSLFPTLVTNVCKALGRAEPFFIFSCTHLQSLPAAVLQSLDFQVTSCALFKIKSFLDSIPGCCSKYLFKDESSLKGGNLFGLSIFTSVFLTTKFPFADKSEDSPSNF